MSQQAGPDGWITLFNGENLDGWIRRNGMASYRVDNGTILGTTAEGSPNSFLCTFEEYDDFELEFETMLVDDELNSGVQIRSQTRDEPYGRVNGPQVEIESSPGEAAYIYGEATGRGWLTPEDELITHENFQNGEWNQYRVVAEGPRIQVWLNGEQMADLTDEEIYETHPSGFIGLQVHAIGEDDGPYQVRWRNIRIRPL